VEAAVRFFTAAGSARCMVNLAPGAEPPEFGSWLEARGFYHHNHWIKLWRLGSVPVNGPPDPRVREFGPAHAEAFARCEMEAFKVPESLVPWVAASVGSPGWRHYAAFDGEEPVGFGALFTSGRNAWLEFGSTRPSHRRQGIQSAIIAARLRDAARLGCEIVVVETADDTAEKPNKKLRENPAEAPALPGATPA
jgi:GNAT superfamily N-acetyltransferase